MGWGLVAGLWALDGARAERPPVRVALVVGNAAYEDGVRRLNNARRDAERMAAVLEANGVEVLACGATAGCFDATKAELDEALGRFRKRAKRADLALVYFAGHGFETAKDGNVLLPVDAGPDVETCALSNPWPLDGVMNAARRADAAVVIVDACRTDPFRQCGGESRGTGDASLDELALEGGGRESLLFVSSTQLGQVASDGRETRHSPFAEAVFAELEAWPTLYFDPLFDRVAVRLIEATENRLVQVPERRVDGVAPAHCLVGTGCIADPEAARVTAALTALRESLPVNLQQYERWALSQLGKTPDEALLPADQRQLEGLLEAGRALRGLGANGQKALDDLVERGDLASADAVLAEAEAAIAALREQARAKQAGYARSRGALASTHDIAGAAGHYRRAAELDPEPFWDWVTLVGLYQQLGQLDEAEHAADQAAAVANTPREQSTAQLLAGDVAMAHSQFDTAQAAYDEGLQVSRQLAEQLGTPEALRDLSVSLFRVGREHGRAGTPAAVRQQRAHYTEMVELLQRVADAVGTPQAQQELAWAREQLRALDR